MRALKFASASATSWMCDPGLVTFPLGALFFFCILQECSDNGETEKQRAASRQAGKGQHTVGAQRMQILKGPLYIWVPLSTFTFFSSLAVPASCLLYSKEGTF